MTTLPPSCAGCSEIWEPQPPGTLRACQPVAVHIYTQRIQRTTQITTNVEECGPGPVFAGFTLAFDLQLIKKHGKTSVMPWWTEENYEEALPGYLVSWLRVQPVTAWLQVKRFTDFSLANMLGEQSCHRPVERITVSHSGHQTLASQSVAPISEMNGFMWDSCWTKQALNRGFSEFHPFLPANN